MTNSAELDQLAHWSESTQFAKTGHDVFSKRRVKHILYSYFDLLIGIITKQEQDQNETIYLYNLLVNNAILCG